MPQNSQHPFDTVAEDLFSWMEGEVDYYVDALQGPHQRSPFSAQTSEKEKKDYYRRQMFKTNPDGTFQFDQPNSEGRDRLLKQYGTRTYADIWEAVRPRQNEMPEPEPDPLEALMPPMPEDEDGFTGPE